MGSSGTAVEQDDDWAPLPDRQHGLHPGEDVELGPARPAPVQRGNLDGSPAAGKGAGNAAIGAPRTAAERRVLADEARGDAEALAALQRRLNAAPGKRSLVDVVATQADRERRRRRAGARSQLSSTTVRCERTAADVPLAVQYVAGQAGRDPREDEAWYRDLPDAEQAYLRVKWASEREQRRARRGIRPELVLGAAGAGGAFAGVAGILATPMGVSLVHVGAMVVVGSVTATVVHLMRGGRQAWAMAGLFTFAVVLGPYAFQVPFVIYVAVLMMYGFGVLGMGEEMRAAGGFDARRVWFPFGGPLRSHARVSESQSAPTAADPPAPRAADPRPADRRP